MTQCLSASQVKRFFKLIWYCPIKHDSPFNEGPLRVHQKPLSTIDRMILGENSRTADKKGLRTALNGINNIPHCGIIFRISQNIS